MRAVSVALQAHLDQPDTTTTRLIKIMLRTGLSYGLAMLDRDVTYDDGAGELDYVATNGFDPSTLSADVGFSVSNAEGYALISDLVPGVTVEMVEAGDFDEAMWICYLVNYEDLSMGHMILDAGDVGEVRTKHGMVWIPELLSYGMRLRQPIGSVWSIKCRAIFGTPADSQTGCGIDLDPLWFTGEVVSVGAEIDLVFTGDEVISSGSVPPQPGRVQWLTGANAGREFPVELVSGNVVTLLEPTGYAIDVGDQYRIRPDCSKRYREDCIDIWENGVNFKGEPYIPVGDSSSIQSPGAQVPGTGGFVGQAPAPPVEIPGSEPLPSGAFAFWPNYPVMNAICLQGDNLLDTSEYPLLADKDLLIFQSFYPTTARLQSRIAAINAIKALQSDPMDTKFFLYFTPSETWKVPPSPGNSDKDVNHALIHDPVNGNPRWIVHRVGDTGDTGRVEAEFNKTDYHQVNMAVLVSGLNSLGENHAQAFCREWDSRLHIGANDIRPYLAGVFHDVWCQRPAPIYQSNGAVLVTDPDYNYDGIAETAGGNAGILMWCAGELEFKNQFESRFPGKYLIPNAGTIQRDYLDGLGAPALPLSNGLYYRKLELPLYEVSNFALGLRIDTAGGGTTYHFNGGGSIASFFLRYNIMERSVKLDANIPEAIGKGAVLMHHSGIDRSPTADDIKFIRFISLLCLLVARAAPCGQLKGGRPFSLDELLIDFGQPTVARSMGTLNESTLVWSTRPPDLTVGAAEFHWFVFPKAIVVTRTDEPAEGTWPSADAAVSCTLPTPPAGKKYQMPDSATYVNPVTDRAMRGQDTTLNNGADVTAISLKPWHAAVALIVDV